MLQSHLQTDTLSHKGNQVLIIMLPLQVSLIKIGWRILSRSTACMRRKFCFNSYFPLNTVSPSLFSLENFHALLRKYNGEPQYHPRLLAQSRLRLHALRQAEDCMPLGTDLSRDTTGKGLLGLAIEFVSGRDEIEKNAQVVLNFRSQWETLIVVLADKLVLALLIVRKSVAFGGSRSDLPSSLKVSISSLGKLSSSILARIEWRVLSCQFKFSSMRYSGKSVYYFP